MEDGIEWKAWGSQVLTGFLKRGGNSGPADTHRMENPDLPQLTHPAPFWPACLPISDRGSLRLSLKAPAMQSPCRSPHPHGDQCFHHLLWPLSWLSCDLGLSLVCFSGRPFLTLPRPLPPAPCPPRGCTYGMLSTDLLHPQPDTAHGPGALESLSKAREQHGNMCITTCETDCQSRFNAWDKELRACALGRPWGMGWGGRWEGIWGWGTHVHLWLIHVNVWQNHCNTAISLPLKLIN